MASGRRPHRRLTENDHEFAKGAMVLGLVALVIIALFYWIADNPMSGVK